jgi:hypothetical protein
MAIVPRYLIGKAKRQNVLLDEAHALSLEHIAPGNLSEAVRFCVAYALARGAVPAAMAAHTKSQRDAVARAQQVAAANPPPGVPLSELYAAPAPTPTHTEQAAPLYSSADAATLDAFANWGDDPTPPSEQPAPILPTLADILASTPDV